MFQTVDWTIPQLGGLLSQVIVKEERQLNEPKPVITVKHPWNPEDLAGRPNTWNPVRQKPLEDTDKMCVRQTFPPRYSRSTMLHERRSDEVLQAFRRQQDGNDGLQMRPAGTSAAPSTMQNVTPEVYAQLKPAYGANDNFATRTSAGLIGLGARAAPHSEPYFSRTVVGPSLRMKSRNAPDRLQVESTAPEIRAGHRASSRANTPGIERYTETYHQKKDRGAAVQRDNLFGTNQFARTPGSAFCRRPSEVPL